MSPLPPKSEQDRVLDRLGVPEELRPFVEEGAPLEARLAAARGRVPSSLEGQLAAAAVLAADPDERVREAVRQAILALPEDRLVAAVGPRTHAKVLELLARLRPGDQALATRIAGLRNANDETVLILAREAGPELCERLALNHERLLITPRVYQVLKENPRCPPRELEKAASFLRMHDLLPEDTAPSPSGAVSSRSVDLEAEVQAALEGRPSPALQARTASKLELFDLDRAAKDPLDGFDFDFSDDLDDFSWDLLEEREAPASQEEKLSLERQIANMSVGQKVKLAYLGNKEVRSILVRDRNKVVATAVVKSGRCTDAEIAAMAGNRNLADEVLREIASNREWLRKYPVKVALVNNPKVPVSVAIGLVSQLQKRDLLELSRNHNVSSVVSQAARRLYRQKYQR